MPYNWKEKIKKEYKQNGCTKKETRRILWDFTNLKPLKEKNEVFDNKKDEVYI